MRAVLVVVLLALCGCSKNRDQLRAIRDRMQLELAERQVLVQSLNERRQEIEALEAQIGEARDAGIQIDEGRTVAASAPEKTPLPPPELPAPSVWEGSESERTRAQILELHARISELDKVVGEVNQADARKRELGRQLDRIKQIKRATDQTNEAR